MADNRNNFRMLAEDTVNVSKLGQYGIGNRIYSFKTDKMSTLIQEDNLPEIERIVKEKFSEFYSDTAVEIKNESTITAIFRLSKKVESLKIGVLNFASAHNPGGGFLAGAMAQEEALAYCSDLYAQQIKPEPSKYYKINKEKNSPFYTDTMIMSNVTFFRDANYNFVAPPVTCKVLTAPAVNQNLVVQRKHSEEEGYEKMESRMRNILNLFIYSGCTDLVLGAYGCGVFGNDPERVANIWKDLLYKEGYIKYFKSITFSIYDNPNREFSNIKVFQQIFR